jgi:hypothetical protein
MGGTLPARHESDAAGARWAIPARVARHGSAISTVAGANGSVIGRRLRSAALGGGG